MNNKNIIISSILLLISQIGYSQIKEEKLILNRKREPETKKIEKKQTSISIEKNYPTRSKKIEDSLDLNYQITNIPAFSDFKPSQIQGVDVNPKFDGGYHNNYARAGYGNYGKVLFDGNYSQYLQKNTAVGIDAHFLRTNGLKKIFPWKSDQNNVTLGVFLKHHNENGKGGINVDYLRNSYNFYGIYNRDLVVNSELRQSTNQVNINGYYDFYSNDILNNIIFKSSLINDKFNSIESRAEVFGNLSKHHLKLTENVNANADLGVKLLTQNTDFKVNNLDTYNVFNFEISPKITFYRDKLRLSVGSNLSFVNSKNNNITTTNKTNKLYWFPNAELSIQAIDELNFYGGITSGIQINSYTHFLSENPYLLPDQYLKPTETKYKVFFGIKGNTLENFRYEISAGYGKLNNILFFSGNSFISGAYSDAPFAYANIFSATYDNGNLTEIKGNAQYSPIHNLYLNGELTYQKYRLNTYKNIYNVPLIKGELGAKYMMFDKKLLLDFRGFFMTDRTTNAYFSRTLSSGQTTYQEDTNYKVGGFFDINLLAEYKFYKNFSIFAVGNNLLNANYHTFNGYRVLGAQILGGIKVIF